MAEMRGGSFSRACVYVVVGIVNVLFFRRTTTIINPHMSPALGGQPSIKFQIDPILVWVQGGTLWEWQVTRADRHSLRFTRPSQRLKRRMRARRSSSDPPAPPCDLSERVPR